jgi:hypothetical protein
MEQAKEALRLAQQHFSELEETVRCTQAQLDEDESDAAKSHVLLNCRGVITDIFGFLSVRDLGNVASTCKRWQFLVQDNLLWKTIVLRKWTAIPQVVDDFRAFYKSQMQKTLPPDHVLNYPHSSNNKDGEEYYLIVEFPHLKEKTSEGPQLIMRSYKLDEALMTDESQNIFETPICSCGEWRCDNKVHQKTWNAQTTV